MRGESGELWVAYIDGEVVRYFTTEQNWSLKLPNSIEVWRERFKEKTVLFYPKVEYSNTFNPHNRRINLVQRIRAFLNLE